MYSRTEKYSSQNFVKWKTVWILSSLFYLCFVVHMTEANEGTQEVKKQSKDKTGLNSINNAFEDLVDKSYDNEFTASVISEDDSKISAQEQNLHKNDLSDFKVKNTVIEEIASRGDNKHQSPKTTSQNVDNKAKVPDPKFEGNTGKNDKSQAPEKKSTFVEIKQNSGIKREFPSSQDSAPHPNNPNDKLNEKVASEKVSTEPPVQLSPPEPLVQPPVESKPQIQPPVENKPQVQPPVEDSPSVQSSNDNLSPEGNH